MTTLLLFGATGMVGRGALLECLADPDVKRVLSVVRRPGPDKHDKLVELVHGDFTDFGAADFSGVDGCLFCLGVSSAGMSEADYKRVTYDFTLAAARAVKDKSPNAAFVYVSGAGTDASEKGSSMWARVKGKTENDLIAMFGERAFMFRPGYIQPVKGVVSSTRLYRVVYGIGAPRYPLLKTVAKNAVTDSATLGRAMIAVVKKGYAKRILDARDINALGG